MSFSILGEDEKFDTVEEFWEHLDRRFVEEHGRFAVWLQQRDGLMDKNLWANIGTLENLWETVTEAPRYYWARVHWRWERSKKGYSTYDLMGLDYYILSWLPDAIRDFRENLHGYPHGFEGGYEGWKEALIKIEEGLRAKLEIREFTIDEDPEEKAAKQAQFEEAWALMGRWFSDLWD